MGIVLRQLGRFEDSLKALNEAIAIREKANGPNHPQIGSLHYAMSQTLRIQRDLEKARHHANRALEVRLATFGPDHPEVGAAYDQLGSISNDAEKPQEALEAFLKGMAIKEKALGKDHRRVTFSAVGAAMSYQALGQPERALPLFYRVLEINKEEQSVRGDAYFGIALSLDEMKRKDAEVLDAARKALEAFNSVKNPAAAEVNSWLAQRAKAKGKPRTSKRP
jgi:tetratricopeptide (TPR) repeat protein